MHAHFTDNSPIRICGCCLTLRFSAFVGGWVTTRVPHLNVTIATAIAKPSRKSTRECSRGGKKSPEKKVTTVQHYTDGSGRQRYKGTSRLRATETLDSRIHKLLNFPI